VYLPKGIPAMKALGNAVNVAVVEKILGNLLRLFHSHDNNALNGVKRNGFHHFNGNKLSPPRAVVSVWA
jgi:hypothetical protein